MSRIWTSRARPYLLTAAIVACYALVGLPLTGWMGPGFGALSALPVAAAALLLGWRGGLVALALSLVINTIHLRAIGDPGGQTLLRPSGIPGLIALLATCLVVGWLRDLTVRLRAQESSLRASERDYRELLEQAADAIFIFGEDGRFVRVNAQASVLTGYTRAELLGLRIHDIVPATEVPELDARISSLRSGPRIRERVVVRRDRTPIPVEVSATQLADGRVQVIIRDVSERRAAEAALRERDERFRLVSRATNDAVWDWNLLDDTLWWNEGVGTLFGYAPAAIGPEVGWWYDHIHPEDRDRVIADIHTAIDNGSSAWSDDYRFLRADGHYALVLDRGFIMRDAGGKPRRMLGSMQDITARKAAEEALRRSEASLAEAQRISHLGSWEYDIVRRELRWSDEVFRIGGYQPQSFVPTPERLLEIIHPDDRARVEQAVAASLEGEGQYDIDHRVLRPDGEIRVVHQQAEVLRDAAGRPIKRVGIVQDVTERRALEARLQHQALHDTLTGLPNRALFLDRLGRALARARRDGRSGTVLFLDLDRFKDVNDSRGHDVGDRLLMAVAARLHRGLRDQDTLARLGGDEFAVLLEDIADANEAARVAGRLAGALEAPLPIDGQEYQITVSVGIVLATGDYARPEDLLRDADVAMYRAKGAGKGRSAIFDPAMQRQVVERLALEQDLRRALERGEFVLHYQPQVDFATGRFVGVEALVRWQHPTRGLVPPGSFIPLAEETGLIRALGRWTLDAACQQGAAWNRRRAANGEPPLSIGVNFSAAEFTQPQLGEQIAASLARAGLDPCCLQVEITESVMMKDVAAAAATMRALTALGVRLALDDFGTGYSSLGYLQELPLDVLKIDRRFVAGLGWAVGGEPIIGAVIALGHALGLTITAEGIETAEQAQLLGELGCEWGQGYHFARPAPAAAAEAILFPVGVPRLALGAPAD